MFYLPLNSVNFCFDRMTRKFSKKCQFCPPKIQCFCGLPQFEKPNISQFFPSVLSKWFGNDFRIDIWRVVRVVEGAALEMLCPEKDPGFESLTLRQSRASTRNSRSGLFSFCSFVLARGRPFAGKWVVDFASPYLYSTSKPF